MIKYQSPGGKYHMTFLVKKSPRETVRRINCTHQRVDDLPGRLVSIGTIPVESRCRRCWK